MASRGVRPPFFTLQFRQAQTMFSQVAPAPAAGHDVVEAQFAGRELPPAILAPVAVAGEDVAAVELDLLPGSRS